MSDLDLERVVRQNAGIAFLLAQLLARLDQINSRLDQIAEGRGMPH